MTDFSIFPFGSRQCKAVRYCCLGPSSSSYPLIYFAPLTLLHLPSHHLRRSSQSTKSFDGRPTSANALLPIGERSANVSSQADRDASSLLSSSDALALFLFFPRFLNSANNYSSDSSLSSLTGLPPPGGLISRFVFPLLSFIASRFASALSLTSPGHSFACVLAGVREIMNIMGSFLPHRLALK